MCFLKWCRFSISIFKKIAKLLKATIRCLPFFKFKVFFFAASYIWGSGGGGEVLIFTFICFSKFVLKPAGFFWQCRIILSSSILFFLRFFQARPKINLGKTKYWESKKMNHFWTMTVKVHWQFIGKNWNNTFLFVNT